MYTLPETPVRRLRDIRSLPSWAPEYGRNLWSLNRSGAVSVEQEAEALAHLDHPEFAQVWEAETSALLDVEVEGTNPRLHVVIHQIIETQLLQNDPPIAREALAHLLEIGVDRHTGIHLIADALIPGMHKVLTAKERFDTAEYIAHLDTLRRARIAATEPSPAKAGRNDPCPCGSGLKYKKCCGATAAAPVIDPRQVKMCLGYGLYAGPNCTALPQNHPLMCLDNLSAVAEVLDALEADAEAARAYRQMIAIAEPLGAGILYNALQAQMEFAMNHPAYAADGIAAARRLKALEGGPGT